MVFVPKTLWDDLPLDLSNHIAQTFRIGVPYEKDILVIGEFRCYRLEGSGNWFCGNLHASRAK